MEIKDKIICVRVPTSYGKKVTSYAKKNGMTVTSLIVNILKEVVK